MILISLASKFVNPKLTKISIVLIQIRLVVHLYKENDILGDIDLDG